jgi:hypothetical protein
VLNLDLAHALDPAALFEAGGRLPDPWQSDFLRSRSRRQLLLTGRQMGKSVTAAASAVHQAVYVPGSLVLILSPSLRQSGEAFRKCLDLYRVVSDSAPSSDESALKLTLKNRSRIVSLPGEGETIRGFSGVSLLIIDEASRVPDELVVAVRPMLATSGGRLVALTTPAGRRGWFYDAWIDGGPTWERTLVPASDCPRISASFLAEERRAVGERAYLQEYQCRFMDVDDAFFDGADIERMLDPTIRPLFPALPPDDDVLDPLGFLEGK